MRIARIHSSCLYLFILAVTYASASSSLAVTFEWATIGNPGNAADAQTGLGAVEYTFQISKHEVTNAQYVEFLNAVAADDTHGLYSLSMSSQTIGGIVRQGVSGSYTYAVKPDAIGLGPNSTDYTYSDKPVVYVSFLNTMRFANWLENGQPIGMQGSMTTEDGAYSLDGTDGQIRNASANFVIPDGDEWHKAAYHKNDGVTANYWEFPNSTNVAPDNNLPSDDTGNSGNFFDGGFTTGDFSYPLTDVGAYTLSQSPYGTFDQAGNAYEWTEDAVGSTLRRLRGGYWADVPGLSASTQVFTYQQEAFATRNIGFRVAYIPEPTALALALTAACLTMSRCRR